MLSNADSTANVERMHHVTVLTGFRGDARDSPPDFLDQFFFKPPAKAASAFGEDSNFHGCLTA